VLGRDRYQCSHVRLINKLLNGPQLRICVEHEANQQGANLTQLKTLQMGRISIARREPGAVNISCSV
jgi:hypothetical protein